MPCFARTAVVPALAAVAVLFAGVEAAFAQKAPDDRCSGTLCDLYYGSSKPMPDQPSITAPAPVRPPPSATLMGGSPQSPTPGTAPSRVQVQGGGLLGMATGRPAERCSGTLCDLYYGGPPPEHPDPAVAPPSGEQAAVDPVEDQDLAPQPQGRHPAEAREVQHCVATGRDPWSCYR